jgi:hypothetical protein
MVLVKTHRVLSNAQINVLNQLRLLNSQNVSSSYIKRSGTSGSY